MFEDYLAAPLAGRFEMLQDINFCIARYHFLIASLKGERAEQIRNLSSYLCRSGFLSAPASSKKRFHLSEPGGLVRHSVFVSDLYLDLLKFYGLLMDETSARLVSLFHDASKAGLGGLTEGDYHKPRYLLTHPTEKERTGENFKYNLASTHIVQPVATLWIVGSFVRLTTKEAQAIVAHDHLYIPENRSYSHRLSKEAVVLCQSDEASLLFECQ